MPVTDLTLFVADSLGDTPAPEPKHWLARNPNDTVFDVHVSSAFFRNEVCSAKCKIQ